MKPRRPPLPLRHRLLALLLPLLLLLAQHGTAWHALGHLQAPQQSSQAPGDNDESLAQHAQCLNCLAFAGIDSAQAPQAWAAALLEFGHAAWLATPPRPLAADAPTATSRGPPVDL